MIKPINPIKPSPIIFGSKSILKTLFKNGELPSVVKGLYGGKLTKDNAIEDLKQFENVQLPNFDGNQCIKGIVKTLKKEGLDILA